VSALDHLLDAVRATKNPTEALVEDVRRAHQEAQGTMEAEAVARIATVCREFGIDPDTLTAEELADRVLITTREVTVAAPKFMVVTEYHAQQSAVHYDAPRAAKFIVGLELTFEDQPAPLPPAAAFVVHGGPITEVPATLTNGTPHAPFPARKADA